MLDPREHLLVRLLPAVWIEERRDRRPPALRLHVRVRVDDLVRDVLVFPQPLAVDLVPYLPDVHGVTEVAPVLLDPGVVGLERVLLHVVRVHDLAHDPRVLRDRKDGRTVIERLHPVVEDDPGRELRPEPVERGLDLVQRIHAVDRNAPDRVRDPAGMAGQVEPRGREERDRAGQDGQHERTDAATRTPGLHRPPFYRTEGPHGPMLSSG